MWGLSERVIDCGWRYGYFIGYFMSLCYVIIYFSILFIRYRLGKVTDKVGVGINYVN